MPKGQPLGIPGAPYATPVSSSPVSQWSLCDTVIQPETVAPTVDTSVLITPLAVDGSVGALKAGQGMLVSYEGQDWLITDTGRHSIDLADRAVTSAVGIPVTARSAPISPSCPISDRRCRSRSTVGPTACSSRELRPISNWFPMS
jgi:hypothetical protein